MGIAQVIFSTSLLCFVSLCRGETPALFVFGDSVGDDGNNNNLPTPARSNYVPYGVDYPNHVPTGRFCNGYQITDFLAFLLALPPPPPYYQLRDAITYPQGANFASASSGVLNETHSGGAAILSEQISAFQHVEQALISNLGCVPALNIISKAIYFIVTTNNDLNNYYLLGAPVPYDRIIEAFSDGVKTLYRSGARKFVLVSPSAVGCIPLNTINGTCAPAAQNISATFLAIFNKKLDSLRQDLQGSTIVEPQLYKLMVDLNLHPAKYGFSNSNTACCELFPLIPIVCQPFGTYCPDRTKFSYWDNIHFTEALNKIAADLWWSGSPEDVSPMNIVQLSHI